MFAIAAGLRSASTGSTSARMRLRAKRRIEVGLVVGERELGRGGELARALALEPEQRTDDAAAAGGEPEQGPAARRDREPVEDGLRDVGAGVAGGDQAGAGAVAEPLGGVVAQRPRGGLQVALERALRALDVEIDPQLPRRVDGRSPCHRRRRPEAVVEVQRVHLLGAQLAGEPAAAQAESAPPETMTTAERAARRSVRCRGRRRRARRALPPWSRPSHGPDATRPRGGFRSAALDWDLRRRSRSRARATNSSTGSGKPFSSTPPIGSNSR